MSLYDDFDAIKQKSDHVAGWSSGIKLFQSQLQLKKASQTQPRREQIRKSTTLAPVINLKSKKDDDDANSNNSFPFPKSSRSGGKDYQNNGSKDLDWNFEGVEYDPMWPNDYEKVVKDLRDIREREKEKEDEDRKRRRDERQRTRDNSNNRFDVPDDRQLRKSGFAGRKESDSEEEDPAPAGLGAAAERPRMTGAAIAPPPSLQESAAATPALDATPPQKVYGASVAAKIMAKYGFKEGQGLGKKEQGISMALQVEKTSKRGGRIIHEKEMMPPPSLLGTPPSSSSQVHSPRLGATPGTPEPSIIWF